MSHECAVCNKHYNRQIKYIQHKCIAELPNFDGIKDNFDLTLFMPKHKDFCTCKSCVKFVKEKIDTLKEHDITLYTQDTTCLLCDSQFGSYANLKRHFTTKAHEAKEHIARQLL